MDPRFAQFPSQLAAKARTARLGPGGIPALLVHPDWERPTPFAIWLHGRTVNKELDPGRYLRWMRAGIGACAIDLPGHGERADPVLQREENAPELLRQTAAEIDEIIDAVTGPGFGDLFDRRRMAIGGMSAGGIAALIRLCEPHPFHCIAVESATGDLESMFTPQPNTPQPQSPHPPRPSAIHQPAPESRRPDLTGSLDRLSPIRRIAGFRPLPLLAVHSEADRIVPWRGMRAYLDALARHYAASGADPAIIRVLTWPATGAPEEHAGFGRFANDAKQAQVEFLSQHLRAAQAP